MRQRFEAKTGNPFQSWSRAIIIKQKNIYQISVKILEKTS